MRERQPTVLAVITAREGSKGLPGKNLHSLAGRPLIEWTISAAKAASCVSRLVISTDSPEIAAIAHAAGAEVPFLRPKNLATDTASSVDVLKHTLSKCPGYEVVLLLQPTSPLRTGADIDAAFDLMLESRAEGCVSVAKVDESPWLMVRIRASGRIEPLLPPLETGMRRQDLPAVYVVNGALYFVTVEVFKRTGRLLTDDTVAYAMSRETSIDIDTIEDFGYAEAVIANRRGSS